MADIAEIMTRQSAAGFRLRLEAARAGTYRALLREQGGDWGLVVDASGTSEFADPLSAMVSADNFIALLVSSRQQATATQQIAAVEQLLQNDQLVRRIQGTPPDTVIVWRVREKDGTTMFPGNWPTPHEAALAYLAAGAP